MRSQYFVTGVQGFVGQHLTRLALDSGIRVLGIGRSPRTVAYPSHGQDQYAYEAVDILDVARVAQLLRDVRPSTVIHLASGLRDDAPDQLLKVNVAGTLALFDAIEQSGIDAPRVVVGSSGGVYGRPAWLPLSEDAACRPIDFYSASKVAQENVACIIGKSRGIEVVIARLFNLIGPGQDERHACARFAQQIVAAKDALGPPTIEIGDLAPTRDFIDVRDAASAMLLLARNGTAGATYNIGSGVETPIGRMLYLMCSEAGLACLPRLEQTYHRAADIPRHVADIGKLAALGHQPKHDLRASIRDLLASFRVAA